MTGKYDECLEELEGKLPEYIQIVGKFQHENKEWVISNHYFVDEPEKCQLCGHYPIKEIFEITCNDESILKIGNVCIDKITDTKIGKWYKSTYRKIERLKKHKAFIDFISGILQDHESDKLPFFMSWQAHEKLQTMLDRLCNGLDLTKSQEGLFLSYVNRAVKYIEKRNDSNVEQNTSESTR